MKKGMKFLIVILLIMFMGCNSRAKDIKLSELKTACDYNDAINKVCNEIKVIKGDKSLKKLNDNDRRSVEDLFEKLDEIGIACQKKYTDAELRECGGYESLVVRIKKLKKIDIEEEEAEAVAIEDSIARSEVEAYEKSDSIAKTEAEVFIRNMESKIEK
ncbi:MAG: hypothetical protein RLZZ543_1290 [Bacteroidota bacterium]|jgi:hypothetical protein